jgi:lipopolysaccharide/colanic/teichoic acid biosynthesis glycosyltransferase
MHTGNPIMSRTRWARGGKRVFDLVAGVLLVILCSPILIGAALAIKLTSRGPLFFYHIRTGWRGVEFQPYKFRTMAHGRQSDAVELVPLDHPEITRVGRFLRRTKIDELPQLFNVVAGQMSLVGPRPDLPEHVAEYSSFKLQRLAVRPGLTGLAQVNGAAAIAWNERIRYDVHYVAHCSGWMDLGILARTIGVIVHGESHYARNFEDSRYYDPDERQGPNSHLENEPGRPQ